jgi:hypothetical protein
MRVVWQRFAARSATLASLLNVGADGGPDQPTNRGAVGVEPSAVTIAQRRPVP